SDGSGRFTGTGVAEFLNGERGGFDVKIDPVEKRAADLRAVPLDLCGPAAAFVPGVAEIAARARVHRGHEHKRAREGNFTGTAGDCDRAVFQRLAENLQSGSLELRQFIEK